MTSVHNENKASETVLVIDDDDDILFSMALALEMDGYLVLTATGVDDAFEVINKAHKKPDYILLDLNLGEKSGADFLKTIKEIPELKKIPVLLMTANIMTNASALALGASGFFTKPFRKSEVVALLKQFK